VLSQILAGTRIPAAKLSHKLLERLDLTPEERDAFVASLADKHRSRKLKRMSRYFREISKELSGHAKPVEYRTLEIDLFRTIADWYHYAILELTFVENFSSDPKWIASELQISVSEVKLAIQRLKELGFLDEKNGKLFKTAPPLLTSDRHLTNSALKRRQKQILEKAITAVDEVPIELRNNTAMTAAIDPARIPEAKQRIQLFLDELTTFLEGGKKEKVYEIAVALVPLQITERKAP
jgi:uncharacterized protein (TIGR02147 family)